MNTKNNVSTVFALLGVYLFLLSSSFIVQWLFPVVESTNFYEEKIDVIENETHIQISYLNVFHSNNSKTIILFPDIYKPNEELLPLAEELSNRVNVIIPQYPNSNASAERLSASNNVRAVLMNTFIDSLHLDDVHIAGFGYGGLIASEIASEYKGNEVEGIFFLNSMGIEEMHFLGNSRINQILYSLLIPVNGIYKYMIPHFGYYNLQSVNESYINSLRQKDQSEMDKWLKSIEVPALVLQAEEDRYIPPHIAREIHRLIPQSYIEFPGKTYESLINNPQNWANEILTFIDLVDSGQPLTKSSASDLRIQLSEAPFDSNDLDPVLGWALISIMILIIITAFINEDIACISSGLLVATGIIEYQFAVLACFSGILSADISTYWIGRRIGRQLLSKIPFKWIIKRKDIELAESMFEMKGAGIIFATRFIPGTRLATYFTAGMLKTNFSKILVYFIIAISLWVPFLVGVSTLIGQPMLSYLDIYQEYTLLIILFFSLVIYGVFKIVLPLSTKKGRREFYVKWIRFKQK